MRLPALSLAFSPSLPCLFILVFTIIIIVMVIAMVFVIIVVIVNNKRKQKCQNLPIKAQGSHPFFLSSEKVGHLAQQGGVGGSDRSPRFSQTATGKEVLLLDVKNDQYCIVKNQVPIDFDDDDDNYYCMINATQGNSCNACSSYSKQEAQQSNKQYK